MHSRLDSFSLKSWWCAVELQEVLLLQGYLYHTPPPRRPCRRKLEEEGGRLSNTVAARTAGGTEGIYQWGWAGGGSGWLICRVTLVQIVGPSILLRYFLSC
uniref:Uncharacterized protein n=1 Tax=Arundo donax TaxID=35708 RepID=A0A0A9EFX7_ARUDO